MQVLLQLYSVTVSSCLHRLCWWVMRDSNSRHLRCKRSALPTELITPDRVLSKAPNMCNRFLYFFKLSGSKLTSLFLQLSVQLHLANFCYLSEMSLAVHHHNLDPILSVQVPQREHTAIPLQHAIPLQC